MAQQNSTPVDRTTALYERVPLPVGDEQNYSAVKSAIESSFAMGNAEKFLRKLQSKKLRIREFESVAQSGALGPQAAAQYAKLSPGDQGQIRELYLAGLEHIDLALRNKYFKLYAYY